MLVSVHDWSRTSSDVLMGSFRIKKAANDKGRPKQQIQVLQNEAGTNVTDTCGKVSTAVLSLTYESEAASPASPAPQKSHAFAQMLKISAPQICPLSNLLKYLKYELTNSK